MVNISVIMPIHNTPINILKQSLNCVLNQTMEKYEVICIDDGSEDEKIQEVLNSYKGTYYDKMMLITLPESHGAGNARNQGLQISNAEYVMFLDSDDLFSVNMLELMYKQIEKCGADVCICNYEYIHSDGSKSKFEEFSVDKSKDDWLCSIPMNPWTKLVRREYLIEKGIYFQSLKSCNDVFFSVMTLLCTDKICCLGSEYLVGYRLGRLGAISSSRNPLNLWKAFEKVWQETRIDRNYIYENRKCIDMAFLKAAISELNASDDELSKMIFYDKLRTHFESVKLDNVKYEAWRKALMDYDYGSKWFEHLDDYLFQLEMTGDTLVRRIANSSCCLCGMGKRGEAFVQWAINHNISIMCICDKKDNRCGEEYCGIKIVMRKDVLNANDDILIIASNNEVYDDVLKETRNDVLNLQYFCPL